MSSNESEDFEDPETEQTQVFQSDQDEMHFYQDEKIKDVSSAEKALFWKTGRGLDGTGTSDDENILIILLIRIYWTLFFKWCKLLWQ